MAGGSHLRGHRRIPASRVSPSLPNSSVRTSPYLQGAQQAQVGLRDHLGRLWGTWASPVREERDGGGAEFQSPRNLVPRNLESEQETHPCRMSLRHKGEKEGVGHTARTHPCTLRSELLQRTRGWEKTHTCLFLYKITYLIWSQIHKIVYL